MSTPDIQDESIDRGVDPELQQTVDIARDALGEVLETLDLDVDLSIESALERRDQPREIPEGRFIVGAFRRSSWREARYEAEREVEKMSKAATASRHDAAEITYEMAILSELLGDTETADRLFAVATHIDPEDGNWQYRQSALRHIDVEHVDRELYRPPLDLYEDFESPEDRLRFFVDLYGLTGQPRRIEEILQLVRAEPHIKSEVFTYLRRHDHDTEEDIARLIEAPTDGIFEEVLIWAEMRSDPRHANDAPGSRIDTAVVTETGMLRNRIAENSRGFSKKDRKLLGAEVVVAREILRERSTWGRLIDELGVLGEEIGGDQVMDYGWISDAKLADFADDKHIEFLRHQYHLRLGSREQAAAVYASEPAATPLSGEIFDAHLRHGDVDMAQARMNSMQPLERVHAAIRMKHAVAGHAVVDIDNLIRPIELDMKINEITEAADGVLTETPFEAHLAEAERELAGYMPNMDVDDWEFRLNQIESMEDLRAALAAISELDNKGLQDDLLARLGDRFQIAA